MPGGQQGMWPGVVLVHEWWGLTDHIKDVARRFAREGFVALAPDLYGEIARTPEQAQQLMRRLTEDRAFAALKAALDYVRVLRFVNGRAGIVGWCMGGRLALMTAVRNAPDATVVFYGRPEAYLDRIGEIKSPLLGLFGEADAAIPLERVKALQAALAEHHIPHEVVTYPDAPHAFHNDTSAHYRPEAARDAWRRSLAFLHEHLR
jgi:carboxymethylenebutenolidase